MAMDNWFQTWHPPSVHFPMNQPVYDPFHANNFSDYTQPSKVKKTSGVNSFLPIFLALNLSRSTTTKREKARPLEITGPFKTWYHWNILDFAYPSEEARLRAIDYQDFIPEHNLPLGIETYKDRIFLSLPKWKPGIPASLVVLPKVPKEPAPKLVPYPNWDWHNSESCDGITSVFRMQADTCGRLWVQDSGQIDITIKPKQVCPPQLLIFDLATDELLVRYTFPEEFIKEDGLYSNIAVDIRNDCEDAYAYLTDVWRYGLVVFTLAEMRAWRITDHLFYPDPLAASYSLHDLEFQWTDGLFGLALSPYDRQYDDRILYFNPMSSFREFYVQTSYIRNETAWEHIKNAFKVIGQSRGASGHVSSSGMDRRGIMFFNLVTRDSIGCWDSRKPYKRGNLGVIARSSETLVFPNDLRIDNERRQSAWIITNKLPYYLYKELDHDRINFRVMSAYIDEAVVGTVCDPNMHFYNSYLDAEEEIDCY